ncbi:hypothetical protein Tco_1260892, partial [Tanacetum coccineum]
YVQSGCTTALNVVPWETDYESVLREAVCGSVKWEIELMKEGVGPVIKDGKEREN